MKFDHIVGFGDSWMWGDELLNPELEDHPHAHPVLIENTKYRERYCFLGLLGEHYQVPVQNYGWPGSSNLSSMLIYTWWLENIALENCLVLVALTEPGRTSFYNPKHRSYANDPPWNRYVHSAWQVADNPNLDAEWADLVKLHTVLTDNQYIRCLTMKQTMLFFAGQNKLKHRVMQFLSIPSHCNVTGHDALFDGDNLSNMLSKHPDYKNLFAPRFHPNEAGHRVIRDFLIKEIDHAILTE